MYDSRVTHSNALPSAINHIQYFSSFFSPLHLWFRQISLSALPLLNSLQIQLPLAAIFSQFSIMCVCSVCGLACACVCVVVFAFVLVWPGFACCGCCDLFQLVPLCHLSYISLIRSVGASFSCTNCVRISMGTSFSNSPSFSFSFSLSAVTFHSSAIHFS